MTAFLQNWSERHFHRQLIYALIAIGYTMVTVFFDSSTSPTGRHLRGVFL